MLTKLHATSQYSAEHQLYTLMYELLTQESIVANDFKTRIYEIMTGMQNQTFIKYEIQSEFSI